MKKLTKENIENMAREIANYCKENNYNYVIMYYNNKREFVNYSEHGNEVEDDINPHDYFDYCAYDHIFSMSSEGGLDLDWELGNGYGIYKIFEKYGLYAELGNSWNCSCFPVDDDMEIEYTKYERPKPTIYLNPWRESGVKIEELNNVYKNALVDASPNYINGSCIIGDGISFELNGQPYFFSTNYQQSDVVDSVIDACKKYLEKIGAENIYYNPGRLD